MDFRIADTFQASLASLAGEEQKAVKTTVFDLQVDPANPGMKFHRLDRAKDKNFWSVRVSRDLRLIVHKTSAALLACYVGHHDDAYRWAERRKLERHPTTGAAQLVTLREVVREIEVPVYVQGGSALARSRRLFADTSDALLLGYGVPPEWLEDVRAATDASLLEVAEHLPAEAAEALLELAIGETPVISQALPADSDPFSHPDALRRFQLVTDSEDLRAALEYPWEMWTVFLHPAQRELVEREFSGPSRVAGSAGTGKTVVALHRAVHLAQLHPESQVLLTTFSDTLAVALRIKLGRLVGHDKSVHRRITIESIDRVGLQIYESAVGVPTLANAEDVRTVIGEASLDADEHRFSDRFLAAEWQEVVDNWQLQSWEEYRDVQRLGRKTGLGEKQRATLWGVFDGVRERLTAGELTTMPGVFARATQAIEDGSRVPFDFAVVDEAQDISVPQLRFLCALANGRPDGLFFAGDLGQRIFQTPFSWLSLGVDVRGRSRTLRVNYRTSHEIRQRADRLLPQEMSDVDGNTERRRGTVSAFSGAEPTVVVADSASAEIAAVANWLRARMADGFAPHEVAVFVRSADELGRARLAARDADLTFVELDGTSDSSVGSVSIGTMDQAKGLEFRAVAVVACDDEIVPLQLRVETVTDDADLKDVYETERQLLYVACTRARDQLLVSGVKPASEFLEDFGLA